MSFFLKITHRSLFTKIVVFFAAAVVFTTPVVADEPRFLVDELYVHDTVAGLTWSRDPNPGDDRLVSFEDAFAFVSLKNKEKFAGFSDWRMPDIEDLKKLVAGARADTSAADPIKDPSVAQLLTRAGFRNIQPDCWSSTTSFYNVSEAWIMNMISGEKITGKKTLYNCVWPVRTTR